MNGHVEAVLNEMGDTHAKAAAGDKKAIPPLLLVFLKAMLAKFGPIILAWLEEWLNKEKAQIKENAEAAGV